MAKRLTKRDLYSRVADLEEEIRKLRSARPRHIGSATPTGGRSGEWVVGNNKIWANDRGTWKSTPIT